MTPQVKKGFSLVEILIAVTLISVVILALLKTNSNNLLFLEKASTIGKNDSLLALGILDINITTKNEEKIYLDRVVDFKDDEIRKLLKNSVIIPKYENLDDVTQEIEGRQLIQKVTQGTYTLENGTATKLYHFTLEIR